MNSALTTATHRSLCIKDQDCKGTLVHCWWECSGLGQPLWTAVGRGLKTLNMELPYDPAISLLGMYPKEPKTHIQKNIQEECTPMFTEMVFTIAKI